MPLPLLNAHRLLPAGVHEATTDDLSDRFVIDFPASESRPPLYAGMLRYRRDLLTLGVQATQWIDGSFVDGSRLDPHDIDLVNFCTASVLDRLPTDRRMHALALLAGRGGAAAVYGVHAFLAVRFPPAHPNADSFDRRCRYWFDWFSFARDYRRPDKPVDETRGRKGIVQILLGDVTLCPVVSDES
ncbi:MAG: hypothetical protein HYY24_09650 [Verrucomicrobia bacterium]|nr:hypothetical protein [Verrucomicrobiota bacterium]